jgi:endonuclease/exonuclease/phosphatase family metal-dependent hydrolase
MTFSILSWNIWYRNQVEGSVKSSHLLNELKRLADQYQPDFIALNEVVKPSQAKSPLVIEYLQKLGYPYSYYSKMQQLHNYWLSGVSLSSRFKMNNEQIHAISKNAYAANNGYPGINKEVISTRIALPDGHDLKIIVAHPVAAADSLRENRVGTRNLAKLIRSDPYTQNTILLGDMNEWRLMPGAFRHKVADIMHSRTGTILHPTWHHNAHRFTPLRLNLDYIYWSKQSDYYLKNFKVLSSTISDHQPIFATFEHRP